MPRREDTIFLGTIKKTHGISGDLNVSLSLKSVSFKKKWESVFILIDNIQVPFFVESFYQADAETLILNIDGIGDIDSAARYLNQKIFVRKKDLSALSEKEDVETFTGYTALDSSGREIGRIREYIAISDNPLFLVERSGDEVYIPARPSFIRKIDHNSQFLTIQLPEGLIESQE